MNWFSGHMRRNFKHWAVPYSGKTATSSISSSTTVKPSAWLSIWKEIAPTSFSIYIFKHRASLSHQTQRSRSSAVWKVLKGDRGPAEGFIPAFLSLEACKENTPSWQSLSAQIISKGTHKSLSTCRPMLFFNITEVKCCQRHLWGADGHLLFQFMHCSPDRAFQYLVATSAKTGTRSALQTYAADVLLRSRCCRCKKDSHKEGTSPWLQNQCFFKSMGHLKSAHLPPRWVSQRVVSLHQSAFFRVPSATQNKTRAHASAPRSTTTTSKKYTHILNEEILIVEIGRLANPLNEIQTIAEELNQIL